jgi:hypothetical protein
MSPTAHFPGGLLLLLNFVVYGILTIVMSALAE